MTINKQSINAVTEAMDTLQSCLRDIINKYTNKVETFTHASVDKCIDREGVTIAQESVIILYRPSSYIEIRSSWIKSDRRALSIVDPFEQIAVERPMPPDITNALNELLRDRFTEVNIPPQPYDMGLTIREFHKVRQGKLNRAIVYKVRVTYATTHREETPKSGIALLLD